MGDKDKIILYNISLEAITLCNEAYEMMYEGGLHGGADDHEYKHLRRYMNSSMSKDSPCPYELEACKSLKIPVRLRQPTSRAWI